MNFAFRKSWVRKNPVLVNEINFPRALSPGEWGRYYSRYLHNVAQESRYLEIANAGGILRKSSKLSPHSLVSQFVFRDEDALARWEGVQSRTGLNPLIDLGFSIRNHNGYELDLVTRTRASSAKIWKRWSEYLRPTYSTRFDIELSTRCVSRCPECPRVREAHLSKDWNFGFMPREKLMSFLRASPGLTQISLCGGYGDAIYHPELHAILHDIQDQFPDLFISIDTNGSHRSPDWWTRLGEVLGSRHYVNFSIDGLADTNSLYRRGTDWDSIITGAKSFRRTFQGRMLWKWIVFKHNQHQVAQGKRLAKELGFDSFVLVDSGRHYEDSEPTIPIHILEKQIAESAH